MAGMRDKLIHGYFGVNYPDHRGIVWDVVTARIPDLAARVRRLLDESSELD